MNSIPISVVMSVHNDEQFLEKAIRSILEQNFTNYQYIIIDDHSTDRSPEILQKYAALDSRIRLITNEINLGLTRSLNIGLAESDTPYIARIDSDDIACSDRLEVQYSYLESNPDITLLGSGCTMINEQGEKLYRFKPITDEEKLKREFKKKNCIYHSSVMFRNDKETRYRDKFIYSQDYDLYLSMLSRGKRIINIPDALIYYRIHSNAISITKKAKQKLFTEKAREFYVQRLTREEDDYFGFDPETILNLDVEHSNNKIILFEEIKAGIITNNMKWVRTYCIKYFRFHGICNKIIFYYILSFFPVCVVKFIKKILKK